MLVENFSSLLISPPPIHIRRHTLIQQYRNPYHRPKYGFPKLSVPKSRLMVERFDPNLSKKPKIQLLHTFPKSLIRHRTLLLGHIKQSQ